MPNQEIDFVKAAKDIVSALSSRSDGLDREELIRYVYNQATDDAINFIGSMAVSNPQHRMAYDALAKELRHYLPLREIE